MTWILMLFICAVVLGLLGITVKLMDLLDE